MKVPKKFERHKTETKETVAGRIAEVGVDPNRCYVVLCFGGGDIEHRISEFPSGSDRLHKLYRNNSNIIKKPKPRGKLH